MSVETILSVLPVKSNITLNFETTHTQNDYSNPRCTCAPRVNKFAPKNCTEGLAHSF